MNQINLNTYLKNNIQERLYLILDHFQPQGKVLLDIGKSLAVESDDFIRVDITNTGTTSLTIERVK